MAQKRPIAGAAGRGAGLPVVVERATGLPSAYRGRGRHSSRDLYDRDHAEPRHAGSFRWLIATCLAAGVGAIAIFAVIHGSTDPRDAPGELPGFDGPGEPAAPSARPPPRLEGLAWTAPKTDKLVFVSGALSTRYDLEASVKQRRDGRDYYERKPYARVVARLSASPIESSTAIPRFDPFKLYSSRQPLAEEGTNTAASTVAPGGTITVRAVELIAGLLPSDDGQELADKEIEGIVRRALEDERAPNSPGGAEAPIADGAAAPFAGGGASDVLPPYTSELVKPIQDFDAGENGADVKVRDLKIGAKETLGQVLARGGSEPWQARAMAEAARALLPDGALVAGQELRVTLVPSLAEPSRLEPARFSILSLARDHKITVARNVAGEFVARVEPVGAGQGARLSESDSDTVQDASVYASIYHTGLLQKLAPATILQIMRIHVYATDFRRRVRVGDSAEFFFDVKEDAGSGDALGELLYTAITAGGDTARFWRFRSADGAVDYYDERGNNSKKFLMKKPVRGSGVRLTSAFGLRVHPFYNEKRQHNGVDWAAPEGTPILAAGNGLVEEAGRKGNFGVYARIRHANGYQTAYAHLLRLGEGIRPGLKVRQGQTIGYVGTTGLSTAPHLHYEVLVNSRFVDPLSIQVPQERQLAGKQLADFQKERARIDHLMQLPPVRESSK